jgi:hypothetical protein
MRNKVKKPRIYIEDGRKGGRLHPNFQIKKSTANLKSRRYALPKLPEAKKPEEGKALTLWEAEPITAYTKAKESWMKGLSVLDISLETGIPMSRIKAWISGIAFDETEEKYFHNRINPWIKERQEKEDQIIKQVFKSLKTQLSETLNQTLTLIQKNVQKLDANNQELSAGEISSLTRTVEVLHNLEGLEQEKGLLDVSNKGKKFTREDIMKILKRADPMISYDLSEVPELPEKPEVTNDDTNPEVN